MIGFATILHPPIPIPSIFAPSYNLLAKNRRFPCLAVKLRTRNPRNRRNRFPAFADSGGKEPKAGGGDGDGEEEEEEEKELKKGDGDDDDDDGGRGRLNVRWGDLLLDPDPDNIFAVGLTGVLAWASAQVLWQLFFISVAILVAALKYSFVAALLLFILITLL